MELLNPMQPHPASELETSELVEAIEKMISWYQTRRSTVLALSITDHIEQLACRQDEDISESSDCDYQRLADVWRYIASKH